MQRSGHILVVDDEAHILNLIVELLEDEGYQVRSASNGAAALALIVDQPPALILMDMYMPQMDGLRLLEMLQQQGVNDIPVVLMTASPRAAEQVMGVAAIEYLAKPFDIEMLLEYVTRYVQPAADPPA
ncbi:MAG TPA: response regulator [Kouleothrix sp.]|uniref:response regulator n=1 Tax=Kouleothrix sp. TaxID=2779161 RepID=UPI002C78F010|nr:response regulator [Kouleothrix sp.]HRC74573.1 response regulator [Kouleothrix sp.]